MNGDNTVTYIKTKSGEEYPRPAITHALYCLCSGLLHGENICGYCSRVMAIGDISDYVQENFQSLLPDAIDEFFKEHGITPTDQEVETMKNAFHFAWTKLWPKYKVKVEKDPLTALLKRMDEQDASVLGGMRGMRFTRSFRTHGRRSGNPFEELINLIDELDRRGN